MTRLPIHQQPRVAPELQLLTSYLIEGRMFDLYGTNTEEDGYTVLDVALTGTNISLHPVIHLQLFDDLTKWCNAKLPTGAELRRVSEREGRAERAIWQRQAA